MISNSIISCFHLVKMLNQYIGRTVADFPHRTPTTNVQTVTPNNQMDSPQNMQIYVPEHNAMKETETDGIEGVNSSGKEDLDLDPVHKFLPPPPEEKCSDELQVFTYDL